MRILLISPRFPFPPLRGDQVRAFHFLRELAEGHEVTLASFGSGRLPIEGIRVLSAGQGLTGRLVENLRTPSPRLPLQVRIYLSAEMRRIVASEVNSGGFDVIHAALARMAPYLPAGGGVHRHLDLMDSFSINMATRAERSRGPGALPFAIEARLLRRYEAQSATEADSVSVISAADRAAPGLANARVIPNGVDREAFPFEPGDRDPDELVFFGNLGYFHNIVPAMMLARETLPLIRRAHPGARLKLVGARPPRKVRDLGRLPGVEVVGPVDDMARALRTAGVALLPMVSGSGMKNKILEAFSVGLPVVTTAAGIQGVEGTHAGREYVLADPTPSAFADATAALIDDSARRAALADAAQAVVENHYSWASSTESLLAAYRSGGADPGAAG